MRHRVRGCGFVVRSRTKSQLTEVALPAGLECHDRHMRVVGRNWAWHPAPGWPEPPEGWSPPVGWEPDPAWPPAPSRHRFWQRTRRGRRRHVALLILMLLPLGGCGAYVALIATDPTGCAFDPPPGEFSTMPISNDISEPVTVFTCDTSVCASGTAALTLPAGATKGLVRESCIAESVGYTNGDGRLLGCLVLPIGIPVPVTYVALSQATDCQSQVAAGNRPRVRPE